VEVVQQLDLEVEILDLDILEIISNQVEEMEIMDLDLEVATNRVHHLMLEIADLTDNHLDLKMGMDQIPEICSTLETMDSVLDQVDTLLLVQTTDQVSTLEPMDSILGQVDTLQVDPTMDMDSILEIMDLTLDQVDTFLQTTDQVSTLETMDLILDQIVDIVSALVSVDLTLVQMDSLHLD